MKTTNPSATKKGPGRHHEEGLKRASPPKHKGTPFGFVQRINPLRQQKREMRGAKSARQFRKEMRYWRSPERQFDILADLQVGLLPGEVAK